MLLLWQAYVTVERVFSVCGDPTSGKKEQAHQEFGNKDIPLKELQIIL